MSCGARFGQAIVCRQEQTGAVINRLENAPSLCQWWGVVLLILAIVLIVLIVLAVIL